MALALSDTVARFLIQRPEQRFTARQIAEWIFETFPSECQQKKNKSKTIRTDAALIQQIVAEISSMRPQLQLRIPEIKTTEGRPRQYYWTEKTDTAEVEEAEQPNSSTSLNQGLPLPKEHVLYPQLINYLWSELDLFSLRLDEKKSSNGHGQNGNKWLFPDIVGMEDLTAGWHPEMRNVVNEASGKKAKLWSFEVKVLLNRSNVRSAYFQAVSNSSWANYGYLVAAEIEGADTMKELRLLYALHGIGLIQLDIDNPAESQILVPARERADVDWATCNRLTNENSDFREFMKLLRKFLQTGEANPKEWDLPSKS